MSAAVVGPSTMLSFDVSSEKSDSTRGFPGVGRSREKSLPNGIAAPRTTFQKEAAHPGVESLSWKPGDLLFVASEGLRRFKAKNTLVPLAGLVQNPPTRRPLTRHVGLGARQAFCARH